MCEENIFSKVGYTIRAIGLLLFIIGSFMLCSHNMAYADGAPPETVEEMLQMGVFVFYIALPCLGLGQLLRIVGYLINHFRFG